jgi:multisubunit Na+/H+ antiporter MnhC subunit
MKIAVRSICSIAILVVTIWINYISLAEAYGNGPPYYSRTTNMDKWSNPIPFLIVVDIIAIGIMVLIGRIKS